MGAGYSVSRCAYSPTGSPPTRCKAISCAFTSPPWPTPWWKPYAGWALTGTEWAQAQVDTVRRKLFKIGAIVHVSVRRIRLQMSSAYPWKDIYARAFHALRC